MSEPQIERPFSGSVAPTSQQPPSRDLARDASLLTSPEGLHVLMRRVDGLTRKGVLAKPFLFQVPPLDNFPFSGGYNWDDYDTEGGPRSRRQKRQLRSIQFRSMFVAEPETYTLIRKASQWNRDWPPNPLLLSREIELIAGGRDDLEKPTPFRLTVFTPVLFDQADVDMLATIRSYEIEAVAGEPDTRYFTISFTEFNPAKPFDPLGRGQVPQGFRQPLPAAVSVAALPAGGDTMHALAKSYYGDPSRWRLIAKQNGLRVAPSQPLGDVLAAKGRTSITIPVPPRL